MSEELKPSKKDKNNYHSKNFKKLNDAIKYRDSLCVKNEYGDLEFSDECPHCHNDSIKYDDTYEDKY